MQSQLKADFGLKALSKNKSQYLAELKDLKSHGIDYPTLYIGGDSESVISRYLRYRESLKFPCDRGYFIYGIADTTVPTSMIESNVKILQSLMQKILIVKSQKFIYMESMERVVICYSSSRLLGLKFIKQAQNICVFF